MHSDQLVSPADRIIADICYGGEPSRDFRAKAGVPNACQLEPDRLLASTNRRAPSSSLTLAGYLRNPYSSHMSPFRARVEKGRLVLDEPTSLPEGMVVDLVADDEGDDLTDDERRELHEALSASWDSAEVGRLRPASAILDELRQRR